MQPTLNIKGDVLWKRLFPKDGKLELEASDINPVNSQALSSITVCVKIFICLSFCFFSCLGGYVVS